MTRPDIAMVASFMCSFCHTCGKTHIEYALRIMGYLIATKNLGITFGGRLRVPYGLASMPPGFLESGGLWIAHDSSWGSQPKPMAGHVIMHNNGPLGWAANKLKIIPQSTCEAETSEGSRAAKSGMFVRNLFANNDVKLVGPTPMLGDNSALFTLVQQEGASVRTRYYERATLLIKRAIQLLVFTPFLVKTTDMIADIFTKATDKGTFVKMRNVMMNIDSKLKHTLEKSMPAFHGNIKKIVTTLLDKLGA